MTETTARSQYNGWTTDLDGDASFAFPNESETGISHTLHQLFVWYLVGGTVTREQLRDAALREVWTASLTDNEHKYQYRTYRPVPQEG